jgi:hypothetical protein
MATKNKKANIHSAMARFEATITKNNESGVESKMYLSNITKNRPSLSRRGASKQTIVPSRLGRVSETGEASSSTASTASTVMMESVHSRESSVGMSEEWGTFEKPNEDPWGNSDDDESFGVEGFGDFGGGDDGFGDFGGGDDNEDDWQNVATASQSELDSPFQVETPKPRAPTSGSRKPHAPKLSGGISGGTSSSRPRMMKSASSSGSKTFMLSGSTPVTSVDGLTSPPTRSKPPSSRPSLGRSKSHSQNHERGSTLNPSGSSHSQESDDRRKLSSKSSLGRLKSSKPQDSDDVSTESPSTATADISPKTKESLFKSKKVPSRSVSGPVGAPASGEISPDSIRNRAAKAPLRTFRRKPSAGDDEDASVDSKEKVGRSTRPKEKLLSPSSSSSRRLATSSRRLSSQD